MYALPLIILFVSCKSEEDKDHFILSGVFEATEIKISSTVGGQVVDISVEEGSYVAKDQIIARIDEKHMLNQINQAENQVALAEAHLRIVEIGVRKEDIKALKEQVRQAEEAFNQAKKERDRVENLVREDSLPKKTLDDADTLLAIREAQLRAVKEMLNKAVRGARPEEIEVARVQKRQAESVLKSLKDRLLDYQIKAPVSGMIIKRFVNPYEVIGPGQPIATVADMSILSLRVFVPEAKLGLIRIGQKVAVRVDSFPEKVFEGRVVYISHEAEFTPRNIQTYEERVKTVYAIKIEVRNPDGVLKIGMPADAEFNTSENIGVKEKNGD